MPMPGAPMKKALRSGAVAGYFFIVSVDFWLLGHL
jgi:hypothetical protein